jgi:N-glycosidase YbiA
MYPDSNYRSDYETDEAIYWFSHPFDTLNNWSPHAVTIWGKRFPTVEHAYHYRKFSESNPDVAEKMLNCASPWAAWQFSRKYRNKIQSDWDGIKVAIMTEINRLKFAQHEDARECLLLTGTNE